MYAQALDQKDRGPVVVEDPEKLAQFEARIEAEEKIEPKDWMPEAYRRTLIRQISPARAFRNRSACSPRATGSPARPR